MRTTSFFSDLITTLFERPFWAEEAPGTEAVEKLCAELLSGNGEITGMRIARTILSRYSAMTTEEKRNFFTYLANDLDVDPEAVVDAARAYAEKPDANGLVALSEASEPTRQELLRRLNRVPGATAQLVRMRLDLLELTTQTEDLARIDVDFVHLFKSWFNRGFLVLRHIDWKTPANILEKIIQYEAVHAITDWDELRRRLSPKDRRCFAFFHPAMTDEPLIFVEIALQANIPGSIQDVLAEKRNHIPPNEAQTAVFYSISNCQAGLRGISFGNSLIKQVVEELSQELPNLKNFVTLSPIPGFSRWLTKRAELDDSAKAVLATAGDISKVTVDNKETSRLLAIDYLVTQKRSDGLPIDPVARFHLGNGASVFEVHALADKSENGMKQSCGAMVNYLYDLKTVEQNHENFVSDGEIAVSKSVRTALKAASTKKGTVANV